MTKIFQKHFKNIMDAKFFSKARYILSLGSAGSKETDFITCNNATDTAAWSTLNDDTFGQLQVKTLN